MMDGLDGAPMLSATSRPLGWLLLFLVASQLLFMYSGIGNAGLVSKYLVLALPLVAWRALSLREFYLLSICVILFGLTWYFGKAEVESVAPIVTEGLSRSAYLASFIVLMALLREGAVASTSVLEVGSFLTRQTASRRFFTVFAGSHFFAVLINLGALTLLAPIIQRGVRADIPEGEPLDEIAAVRERRQLSAALRGFSWFLVWAPTAVTQAVLPTILTGIDAVRLMAIGLLLALIMFVVSWLEDMARWHRFRKRLQAEGRLPFASATRFPFVAARRLGVVCLVLFGLTVAFTRVGAVSVVTGVMLAAPIVVALWIFAQQSSGGVKTRARATSGRLREIVFGSMPGYAREAVFIACAGFIGTLAANLVLAAGAVNLIGLENQPGWLFMWILTLSALVFGQVGLSPITMAVFLGSLVAELPSMPVDITLAALAIAAGTAVCTSGAPFASGAVMLARATGYSAATLTWRWNGVYTVVVLAVLAVIYAVFTSLL
jgi:hypothetical protein